MREWMWSGRPWTAFKNFAVLFSFMLNVISLSLFLAVAVFMLPFIRQVTMPMVSGLSQNFTQMRDARIVRTIEVSDSVPIQLSLPIATETTATIVQAVPMAVNTNFVLPGGGGNINGTVYFELPAGTQLPVALDLVVPISQTVPLDVAVEVDIPLADTELRQPLNNLLDIFAPIESFLDGLPADSDELLRRLLGRSAPDPDRQVTQR
jgi:hypothetical protein